MSSPTGPSVTDFYSSIGISQAAAPKPIIAQRAPTTNDLGYAIGQLWVNQSGDVIYCHLEDAAGIASWVILGGSSVAVEALSGNTGTAVPSGGVIQIATDSNLNSVGAANAVTVSMAAAIAPATSVTSGSFITSSATLGVTYSTNTINATGSNANIDININPKGTGQILASRGVVGAAQQISLINTDNTNNASDAVFQIACGGAAAGSPWLLYNINSATQWAVGPRNDDADAYYICQGSNLTINPTLRIDKSSFDFKIFLGNLQIGATGKQLQVKGGAVTDFIGQATLVNGVATILNTNIAATDRVFLSRSAKNASTAYGVFQVTISAGVNFVITACKSDTTTETNDQSTVDYFIVRSI